MVNVNDIKTVTELQTADRNVVCPCGSKGVIRVINSRSTGSRAVWQCNTCGDMYVVGNIGTK